jgi:hypothetical protein
MNTNAEKSHTGLPLFGIIKLTLIWILNNLLKFIIPIIIGLGLIIIIDINFENFKNNIFVMIIMSFENILVCYIILTYFCIDYFNKKINHSKIIKILFVLFLSIVFNYIILLLDKIKYLSVISFIFTYIGFTLFALSIINIIIFDNNWGLKMDSYKYSKIKYSSPNYLFSILLLK